MDRTEVLSDFQRGTVIGCHLSNKSIREISALLELPRSVVSNVLVKWKRLGLTMALPRSGKPQKSPQQDRRVLKGVVNGNRRSPAAARTTESQTASGSAVSPRSVGQKRRGRQSASTKPKNRRKTKPVIKLPVTKQNKAKENTVDEKPG